MNEIKLRSNHQTIIDKFIETCKADERIVAALQVGSYIKGTPDEHSDLDLYIITKDDTHNNFNACLDSFIRTLGDPLFFEDFDIPNIVFLIFKNGAEVELSYIRESDVDHVFNGPFKVLVDKKNILAGITPQKQEANREEQKEKLRRLIYWFWHDFSHFVTAMGRNQLWWAYGQLDVLRSMCVGLARLQHDFSDTKVEGEVYFKIENILPTGQLSALKEALCPMEKESMMKAGLTIIQFYQERAVSLAQAHGIDYPKELEMLMIEKLNRLAR